MGTTLPLPKRGRSSPPPKFLAHVCCGQTARWMKLVLGTEVGLSQGDFVLDGDPAPLSKSWAEHPQIFGPCLLRPNGWMNKAGTCHGGDFVLDGDPVPFPQKGRSPLPNFQHISIVAKWLDASRCHLVWTLASAKGTLDFMLDGDPVFPPQQRGRSPLPIFGPFLLCPNGWMHQDVIRYGGRP